MKVKVHKIKRSTRLPNQIRVDGASLVCKDGTAPDFTDFPDGPVVVIPKRYLKRLVSDQFLLRSVGG